MRALSQSLRRHRRGLHAAACTGCTRPCRPGGKAWISASRVCASWLPPGASGIGLEIARAFGAKARKCTCAMSTSGARAARRERPASRITLRRRGPRRGRERLFEEALQNARRPRRAGEQRRHRRADRQGRGDQSGGLGPLPRDLPDRTVQLRAAGGAAPAARAKNASIVNFSSAAGASASPCARPTRRPSGA